MTMINFKQAIKEQQFSDTMLWSGNTVHEAACEVWRRIFHAERDELNVEQLKVETKPKRRRKVNQ